MEKFYKEVDVRSDGAGFVVCLDGKPLKTPAGVDVHLSALKLADALAAEWRGQAARFDANALALTRIINTGLDHVGPNRDKITGELIRFGQSDAICYRASGPDALVDRQARQWQPLLDWSRDVLQAPLEVTTGIQFVSQPTASLTALRRHIALHDDIALAALHEAVSLCGSLVIGLALSHQRLDWPAAWAAARVDEVWQMENWGSDDAAVRQAEARKVALRLAALVLEACRP